MHRIKAGQQEPRSCGGGIGQALSQGGGEAGRRGERQKGRERARKKTMPRRQRVVVQTARAALSFLRPALLSAPPPPPPPRQPRCGFLPPGDQWENRGSEGALPTISVPAARTTPPPHLPPSVPGGAGPLLWHLWSVTSAQEAYKSTCVRRSPVQNNFQFTRNNYHPQIIACTQAGEEGSEGEGRQEAREGGRERGGRRAHQAGGGCLAKAGV